MLTKSPSSIGHLRSSLMKPVVHALKIRSASGSPGRTPETSLQVRSVWRTRKKVSVCQEPRWSPPVQNREAPHGCQRGHTDDGGRMRVVDDPV